MRQVKNELDQTLDATSESLVDLQFNQESKATGKKKQAKTPSIPSPTKSVELDIRTWAWSPAAGYILAAATIATTVVRLQGSPEQIEAFSIFTSMAIPIAWVTTLARGNEVGFKVTNYLFFSFSLLSLFL